MSDENYRLVQNDPIEKSRDIFINPRIEDIIHQAELASDKDIHPTIIPQGSSGSYFVRDSSEQIIAVFKPRDEEPYEPKNPKWGKYFHRVCCPCCFGRPCLLTGHGYLSEVGASLIDESLGLGIVPTTRLASLTSSAFNHGAINIAKSRTKTQIAETFPDLGRKFNRLGVPPKTGSLQEYVRDYRSADTCIDYVIDKIARADSRLHDDFVFEFQKLVVLDYVIRNTDRSNSNWLVRWNEDESEPVADGEGAFVRIAAIDNGLAFPYKHPDQMRLYPYHWAWLTVATVPFGERIRSLVLPKLSDVAFVERMVEDLCVLFRENVHFKKSVFDKQMSVMRGQITNLCAALRREMSPAQLVEMAPMTLELAQSSENIVPSTDRLHSNSSDGSTRKQQIFHYVTKYWKRPFFRKF